jgi:hypothetical protein
MADDQRCIVLFVTWTDAVRGFSNGKKRPKDERTRR